MPYHPSIFYVLLFRFLSRNHSVIISLPLHYHPILSPYFTACLVLGVNPPSSILLLPRHVVEYSVRSLLIRPDSHSGILASKHETVAPSARSLNKKSHRPCAYAIFFVPLQPQTQKFADIIKKAFIDACFGTSKSGKFLYPKQDSNERPLICI